MPDAVEWIAALRSSHDRFAAAVSGLDDAGVRGPSYASEWSVADVASHLGSQAEIFTLFLRSGLSGEAAPGGEAFGPIWDTWNAKVPLTQVSDSIAANEQFVVILEGLGQTERAGFALSMFGTDLDLAGMLALRLGEHAVHVWDVAVQFDPDATIAPDAVALLIDTVGTTAARAGKPAPDGRVISVRTSAPERRFLLSTGPEVSLTADLADGSAELRLSAEALIRLVFGRLDPDHTPDELSDGLLAELRPVFPGF